MDSMQLQHCFDCEAFCDACAYEQKHILMPQYRCCEAYNSEIGASIHIVHLLIQMSCLQGNMTPLQLAASKGYADIAGVLLTHGADPYVCKTEMVSTKPMASMAVF